MVETKEDGSFGQMLRTFRKEAYVKRVGRLSQEKFAKLLSDKTGMLLGRNHVIRWEKDISPIPAKERGLLVAIIRVLVEHQGIRTLEQANRLLIAGHYGLLNDAEIANANPAWRKDEPGSTAPETVPLSTIGSIEGLDEERASTLIVKAREPIPVTLYRGRMGPGSAPPPPSLIIGRDTDLHTLKERLGMGSSERSEGTLQILTAIKGWPGVGKTTIASALAHDPEIQDAFPDGILWVSLGTEPNLSSEMAAWGRALGTDELLRAKTLDEAQGRLAALLRNKGMLLIIDDVWQPEHARPFTVGGPRCATLVTTRRDDVANSLAPTARNIFRLGVLENEDALILLTELAPAAVQRYPDECLVLAQTLEGLPLALQVAGRLLNAETNRGFGVLELIEELREGARLLEAHAPPDRIDLVNETTPTIAALLQKSLDRLDTVTRDYYAYLGVFAPKPATFDLEAMKSVWQVEDPKPFVTTLVDRGLLEYVAETNRYQMHAVLVMLAKSLLTDD